jgi:hypothetical protein
VLFGGINPFSGQLLTDTYLVHYTDAGIGFDPLVGSVSTPRQRYYPTVCSSLGERYLMLGAVYQGFNYLNVSEVWSLDVDAGWFLQNDGDGGTYFVDDAGIDDDAGSLLEGPPGVLNATCVSRQ